MAFFEFNVALSGLYAAQRGLQVTGNNISNATTTGYSRQVITQKASKPISGLGVGMTGTGTVVTSTNRVRNTFLDHKLWKQNGLLGEYNIKVSQNSIIESTFGSTTDTGFSKVFNNIFSVIDDLSKKPADVNHQTHLKENLVSYCEYYNNIAGSLKDYRNDLNIEMRSTVQNINNYANRIASLNRQIFQAEIYNEEASSLRDERDLCIDKLSEMINVSVIEEEVTVGDKVVTDGSGNPLTKTSVYIAGQLLVEGEHVNLLEIKAKGADEKLIDAKIQELKALYQNPAADPDEIAKAEKELKQYKGINIEEASGNKTITLSRYGKSCELLTKTGSDIKTLSAMKEIVGADEGMYDIEWRNGLKFDETDVNLSGELKGIIDMRDGLGTETPETGAGTTIDSHVTYSGIPYYINKLNNYVQVFARSLNEAYSKDTDGSIEIMDGVNGISFVDEGGELRKISAIDIDSEGKVTKCYYRDAEGKKKEVTGMNLNDKADVGKKYIPKYQLFTYTGGDSSGTPDDGSGIAGGNYTNVTAENFSVSKQILSDLSNIRVSYDKKNESDGSLWRSLLALKDNDNMFKQGDPKDYMSSIFTSLGVSTEQSQMYQTTQTAVTKNIINQRLSVSQVDTSEEFTYLIQYQQAYQAAAKMMSTIDKIYDTTIFKLGNF